jgi:glycosyltransferase involved in cell wall biosynthesis
MICDFYNESLTYQENILAKYYIKFGHEVTIISSVFHSVFDYINDTYDQSWPQRTYFADGVKIIKLRYRVNFFNRIRVFPRLDKILSEEEPDLIFVHDIMFNIIDAVRYLKLYPSAQLIMDYHADYSNSGKNWLSLKILHGVIRKRVLDRVRPYIKKIFPVVPASGKFLHEIYKVPYEDMELLPLGSDLDTSRLVMSSRAGFELRKKHSIADNSIVIFTGGKLTPAKRTEVLIESFLQLNRSDIWLVVVGDGGTVESGVDADYMQFLRSKALGCNRILFTGWLNSRQVLEYLDMSDFAVFPSSQSILWQQAIGMGKPLIVGEPMAVPGGKQDISYLNLYNNIILADLDNSAVDGLRSTINDLVMNPNKITLMSRGAHQVAAEILDWNCTVTRTLQFNLPSL